MVCKSKLFGSMPAWEPMGIGFGGFTGGGGGGGGASSDYVSKTGIGVRSAEDSVDLGMEASTVAVYGFNQTVEIAFKDGGDERFIPLDPSHQPFSVGIETDTVYHQLATGSEQTEMKIIALK